MNTGMVTVSPKYQVVIPAEIRGRLHIKPGEKLVVVEKGGHIHLVPVRGVEESFGMFKGRGLSSKGIRDKHGRFD